MLFVHISKLTEHQLINKQFPDEFASRPDLQELLIITLLGDGVVTQCRYPLGAVINLLLVQCITEHLISTIETSDVAGEEWSWCAGVMVWGVPGPVSKLC